jgi:hypothetical protein
MCAIGLTYPFTHHINRLLMLLQEAGMIVDAPLERGAILAAVISLVQKIDTKIGIQPT